MNAVQQRAIKTLNRNDLGKDLYAKVVNAVSAKYGGWPPATEEQLAYANDVLAREQGGAVQTSARLPVWVWPTAIAASAFFLWRLTRRR